jgi:hypothetical protein
LKSGLPEAWIESLSLSDCRIFRLSGDSSGGVTPVPIPNTEVKPSSADGTALATMWESRSSPDLILKRPQFD